MRARSGRRLGLRLDDGEDVAARVDEPGGPRVAHVGDAICGHRIGRDVVLDTDAAAAQPGHRRVDVRHPPAHLGLRVLRADRAPGDHELAHTGTEHDPVVLVLAGDLEAEDPVVELRLASRSSESRIGKAGMSPSIYSTYCSGVTAVKPSGSVTPVA